jgi:N-acetylglucosaminyl-diphospho-decaprenol L-rhamnosyltransferase
MRTAIITPVSGRAAHLQNQLDALDRSLVRPDLHVVVTMDDPAGAERVSRRRSVHVEQVTSADGRLPIAAARNLGADTAIALGAELLVFLDVDCLPTATMLGRYVEAHDRHRASALFCGPVTYLPPPGPQGYQLDRLESFVDPHPARPVPPPGELIDTDDHTLFWSLSFAVRTSTWNDIGGFFTGYIGYGGEDTDFAQQAARQGIPLCWVGGADALHQYHRVSDPPVEHLDDILSNAAVFYERWGWWPMQGWLNAFERLGLIAMSNGVPERTR